MELDVLKANEGLAERVSDLQAKVAKQQKMLNMYMELFSNFGHFFPGIIEDFKNEIKKLDAEGTVVGDSKSENDQEEEESTIYANLLKDGISASDDLDLGDRDDS